MSPFLLDDPKTAAAFPKDVQQRARELLKHFGNAIGAYTDSRGSAGVRKEVADFIERRDGYPSNPEVCIDSEIHRAPKPGIFQLWEDCCKCKT